MKKKMMYSVMDALFNSGIPIDFKGAMVLKACLMKAGYPEETRHTADIDANWYSEIPPTASQLENSLETALKKSGVNLHAELYRMYGEGRSAGIELSDPTTGEVLFTMDVDVNRPVQPSQIYVVEGLHFRGITPSQMLADKVSTVSSHKVFRRIKDVMDLYYFSKVFEPDREQLLQALQNSGRTLGDFRGFLQSTAELKHAYEKFRFSGGVNKPPFDEVYDTVKDYLKDVIPKTE